MDKLKKDLEVLKSWGVESIPVDTILSMIEETKDDTSVSPERQDIEIPSAVVTTAPATNPCTQAQPPSEVANAFPVGGTIFYIDDKADGIYEFFDVDGNLIKDVKVGDRPHAYRVVKKGSVDKYYVYHDEMHMAKRWAYYKDGSFVYSAIDLLGKGIGKGKTNTEIMMARDNGAYVTANSSGCPTIWYQLQRARDAKVGGCDDWFVPSKKEIEALRLAIKSGSITGGEIAGASYDESIFSKSHGYYIWSSSGYSSQYAWLWHCPNQSWYTSYKASRYSVVFTRAF